MLAFLIIPALEITVFIWVGGMVGPWWVFALIIITGLIGVTFAKKQGMETWKRAQESIRNHQPPGDQILDGICIIAGGIFLLTPGFITDFFGFLFIIPITRQPFKALLKGLIANRIAKGKIVYRKW